jgi:hypothetical protein
MQTPPCTCSCFGERFYQYRYSLSIPFLPIRIPMAKMPPFAFFNSLMAAVQSRLYETGLLKGSVCFPPSQKHAIMALRAAIFASLG